MTVDQLNYKLGQARREARAEKFKKVVEAEVRGKIKTPRRKTSELRRALKEGST